MAKLKYHYNKLGQELEQTNDADMPHNIEFGDTWSPDASNNSKWGNSPKQLIEDDDDNPKDKPKWRVFGEEMEKHIKRPLIFVPGIMGSELYTSETKLNTNTGKTTQFTGKQVWPPFHHAHGSGDVVLHNLNSLFLDHLIPKDLIEGVYEPLITFLEEEMGYVLNETLFIFSYNWVQSNLISGRRLAGFIQLVINNFSYEEGQDKMVDIVNHSMGGLVTRSAAVYFKAPIYRTAYLASPHYGAGKAYFTIHPKHQVKFHDNIIINYFAEQVLIKLLKPVLGNEENITKSFKKITTKINSAYELLPDGYYFKKGKHPVTLTRIDGSIVGKVMGSDRVDSWGNTYLRHNSARFPNQAMRNLAKKAMTFKFNLGEYLPGVINLVIYSDQKETYDRIPLEPSSGKFGEFFDSGDKGDGTVPTTSAKGPDSAIKVPGSHNGVPNNRATFYWLARFLVHAS